MEIGVDCAWLLHGLCRYVRQQIDQAFGDRGERKDRVARYWGPRTKRQPLALTVKHLITWGGPKYPIRRLML
jgi:hypothetical protein